MAERLGTLPANVILFGVQKSRCEPSDDLSDEVKQAWPGIIAQLVALIDLLTRPRSRESRLGLAQHEPEPDRLAAGKLHRRAWLGKASYPCLLTASGSDSRRHVRLCTPAKRSDTACPAPAAGRPASRPWCRSTVRSPDCRRLDVLHFVGLVLGSLPEEDIRDWLARAECDRFDDQLAAGFLANLQGLARPRPVRRPAAPSRQPDVTTFRMGGSEVIASYRPGGSPRMTLPELSVVPPVLKPVAPIPLNGKDPVAGERFAVVIAHYR